ncbi:SDR family NAD(P)-dependent oxidoreductase [Pseudomonas orientalis]|uniref:SDR family NAD(P)-dependent oxidoreductase n=1 Tax=Pseudomonas orientalis TaxID=76758 RepID=UPI000F564B33
MGRVGFSRCVEPQKPPLNPIIGAKLVGTFCGCHAALKHMIQNCTGRIINTSSAANQVVQADCASYGSSKFAVIDSWQLGIDSAKVSLFDD